MLLYQQVYLFIGSLAVLFLLMNFVYLLPVLSRKQILFFKHYIQGTWQRKGVDEEGRAWSFTYRFKKDQFEMVGDPSFYAKGNYRILKEVESLLVIEMINVQHRNEGVFEDKPNFVLEVGADKKKHQITIANRTYSRIE